MVVLVDTREQIPFWKPAGLRAGIVARRIALNVGDYTTPLLLGKVHIERKSLCDLYGTLINSHPRFRREVLRAALAKTKLVVVVEGSHADFINKKFPRGSERKAPTQVLKKIIVTIKKRYGLEIIFCRSRLKAQATTLRILRCEERKLK